MDIETDVDRTLQRMRRNIAAGDELEIGVERVRILREAGVEPSVRAEYVAHRTRRPRRSRLDSEGTER